MFARIFIETAAAHHPRTQKICSFFPRVPTKEIDKIEDIWGRVKKPYLQKREELNLFIGIKKGTLVKSAPPAYGQSGDPHYYFIHAWNCIYECKYCYLQGYFHTPDLALFINHEDIGDQIKNITHLQSTQGHTPWFHAGEYSDSLALAHITDEIPFYFELFQNLPKAKLELRTKSANIGPLLAETPLPNVLTSFSLSPEETSRQIELKAPGLKQRIKAIKKLADAGHPFAIHLDPIIYTPDYQDHYAKLLEQIHGQIPLPSINYFSLGILRFTQKVFHQVQKNYPQSLVSRTPFGGLADGKLRQLPTLMRSEVFGNIKRMLLNYGVLSKQIYICMEDEASA